MSNTPSHKSLARWFHNRSLALRLTAFYTAAGSLLLMISSLVVYFWIADFIRSEDDERLVDKLRSIQAIVGRTSSENLKTALDSAVGMETVAESLEPSLIRVKNARQDLVTETPRMGYLLPPGTFDAAEKSGLDLRGKPDRLVGPTGRVFRAGRREAVDLSGQSIIIYAAVDHEREINLLEGYREILLTVNIIGCVFSAGIGYLIARRGLAPLSHMGDAVLGIRALNLDQRVDSSKYPRELVLLASNFNQMLQGLEDAFARLSRYSADIAHELRTPINNIRGEAEVALSRNRSEEEYRETLGSCLEECQRLSRLIDNLLFIARSENPAVQIQRENLGVSEQLEDIAEFYSPLAADSEVTLEYFAPADLSCRADRHLFRRAIGNLIENAIKYSTPKSHIRVTAESIPGFTRVKVVDNGIGIPAEHLPHIFNRFYRVDVDRSKETGGSGLGLAIVRTIAALHEGKVAIESQVGKGTTVTMDFKT